MWGTQKKIQTDSKQRQIPLGGWFSKNLAQSLIHTRSCPEALKEKQTELLWLKTETEPGTLLPATPDPHPPSSLPQGSLQQALQKHEV